MAIRVLPTDVHFPTRLEHLVADFVRTTRPDAYAACDELDEAIGALLAQGDADEPAIEEMYGGMGLPPAEKPPIWNTALR